MIVKVQVPLASSDPNPPAMVYNRGKQWLALVGLNELPQRVIDAAKITGKAYFRAELSGGDIVFHEQVPLPNW